MGIDFDGIVGNVREGFDKACNKFEEEKNSEETRRFMESAKAKATALGEKAKDVSIDVGLKTAEIADELSERALEAMQKASDRRDAQKAQRAQNAQKAPVDVEAEISDSSEE